MTRWLIEKSGSGIEKSGSGIEKAGSGIEKSGSGIEKAGSGVEKAGSGLRQVGICLLFSAITFAAQVSANESNSPLGNLQIVVENDTVAVSWIIDGSVFSGVTNLSGSYAALGLTEIGLASRAENLKISTKPDIMGSGTGIEILGSGTGVEILGSGTGVEILGSGTGVEILGSGTGVEILGSGSGVEVLGSGSGVEVLGSGSGVEVLGSGTGSDAIVITLPGGTDMQMEVTLGCNSASVSVLDSNFAEVVSFANVPVVGASSYCSGNSQGFGGFYDRKLPAALGDRR